MNFRSPLKRKENEKMHKLPAGFEPAHADYKSAVLPLYDRSIMPSRRTTFYPNLKMLICSSRLWH